MAKISVMGAGNVGGTCAAAIAAARLGNVYLYDVVEDLAIGKAMDINQAGPYFHSDSRVVGCNDRAELAGSDIVIMTAGAPRREGMTRADLLKENLGVIASLAGEVAQHSAGATVIIVTNPVDVLTWHVNQVLPALKTYGLGCSLDALRFRFFLAEAAQVSVESVSGLVIGTHDNNMFPLVNHAAIGGVGVRHLLTDGQIETIINRTKVAGTTIVKHLKRFGSYYAVAHSVAAVVEAIVRDTKGIFPLSVPCPPHYGHEGLVLSLPAVVGAGGVERVLEIDLDDAERAALDKCGQAIGETIKSIGS